MISTEKYSETHFSLDSQAAWGANSSAVMVTKEEVSRVMAAIGRKGGQARTPAKIKAARKNGRKAKKSAQR